MTVATMIRIFLGYPAPRTPHLVKRAGNVLTNMSIAISTSHRGVFTPAAMDRKHIFPYSLPLRCFSFPAFLNNYQYRKFLSIGFRKNLVVLQCCYRYPKEDWQMEQNRVVRVQVAWDGHH